MTHRAYPSSPDKIEQVKECIARLETGWNHKNAYLWASAFTEPCEYIDGFGHYHRRWTHDQNAALHEKGWNTVYMNSHAKFSLEGIEFYNEHLAVLIINCEINYELRGEEKQASYRITSIMEKQGPEWFIRHYQNTPVR